MIFHRRAKSIGWFGMLGIAAALGAGAVALGQIEKGTKVQWASAEVGGGEIKVPGKTPSVLLFVMANQDKSLEAIRELGTAVKDANDVQVAVVISGEKAAEEARKMKSDGQCPWPIVADADYSASARLSVRVWPTTVVVQPSGEVLAHMAGLSKSFARDMAAYLAFATKQIDQARLDKELANNDVVGDSEEQIASRHLMVAQRLLDKGLPDQARAELESGLKLHPKATSLKVAMVRVLVVLGDGEEALRRLDQIDHMAIPPAQANLLRGKALSLTGKFDEAAVLLKQATKLNPEPAEAWYELGVIYEQQKDWQKASDAFRHAFDSTETGRKLHPSTGR